MGRLDEVSREIADVDQRLAALPPEDDDGRADLLTLREELAAEAAELRGEAAPARAVEPEADADTIAAPDRDIEAGG